MDELRPLEKSVKDERDSLANLRERFSDETSSDEGHGADVLHQKMPDPLLPVNTVTIPAFSNSSPTVASSYASKGSSDFNKRLNSPNVYNERTDTLKRPLSNGTGEKNRDELVPGDRGIAYPRNQQQEGCNQSTRYSEAARQSHVNLESLDVDINNIKAPDEHSISFNESHSTLEDEDSEWPVLSTTVSSDTTAVECNGSLPDVAMWDLECCRNKRYDEDYIQSRYFHLWTSADFRCYHDTTFLIGPQEVNISGLKLLLLAVCENESFRDVLNTSNENLVIRFPNLCPAAFWNVLRYVYTQNIKLEDLSDALGILEVVKSLGLPGLQRKCRVFLQSKIDCQNVFKMFCWALEVKDEHLRQTTTAFITRHIWDVLSSHEFLQLSKENLRDFLQNDDWFIADELQVFRAVIRWAEHKIKSTCLQKEKKPSGSELRNVIGPALYQIRFTSFDNANKLFLKVFHPYQGLFTPEESIALGTYLAGKSSESITDDGDPIPTAPSKFNNLPRTKIEHNISDNEDLEYGTDSENTMIRTLEKSIVAENFSSLDKVKDAIIVSGQDSMNKVKETSLSSPMPKKRKCADITTAPPPSPKVSEQPSSASIHSQRIETTEDVAKKISFLENLKGSTNFSATSSLAQENEAGLSSPPPKKRCDNETSSDSTPSPLPITSHQPSSPLTSTHSQSVGTDEKVSSLLDYVKWLLDNENSIGIERIDKVLKITTIPQHRVYLPKLKEFNLTLKSSNNRNFDCGSALKSYIKTKWVSMSEILFFDTKGRSLNSEEGPFESLRKNSNFLSELLTFKVNVSISFAGIVFLKINYEEGVIVMNLIKDSQIILDGARNFPLKVLAISECELNSLDEVNTNMLEVIVMRKVKGLKNHAAFLQSCRNLKSVSWHDLGLEDLNLTENLLNRNPYLKKVALAKCKLQSGSTDENFLEELYLDNCDFRSDVVLTLPKLVFVQKVQFYILKWNPTLLLEVLQMESLQWLFVWELTYDKVKIGKKRVLTEDSQKVQQFLCSIFDAEYCKRDPCTFILEKKNGVEKVSPCTSSSVLQEKPRDPFDPSDWKGTKLGKKKYNAISELDFKHFSYDIFFSSYKDFEFFEMTKKKQIGGSNNKDRREIPSGMETAEPVSNSSVDEAVDIVEIN